MSSLPIQSTNKTQTVGSATAVSLPLSQTLRISCSFFCSATKVKETFLEARIRSALSTRSCIHLRVILSRFSFSFGFGLGFLPLHAPFCPAHSSSLYPLQFLSTVTIHQELAWIPFSSPKI